MMNKPIYEAYVHFSGTNHDDLKKFTSGLEVELDYYEINVLNAVTENLVMRLSSCQMNRMANDVFPLKFDYAEEPEYEYEIEYEAEADEIDNRPNVILITLDDLGMGDVSWLNDFIQMPNLDSLKDDSIILTQATVFTLFYAVLIIQCYYRN